MLTLRRRSGGNWYIRGTLRVGHERINVREQSTGCPVREDAEKYKAKLTKEIVDDALHGSVGQASRMTFADAGMVYLNRPGGLSKIQMLYLSVLNSEIGDDPLLRVRDAWSRFKRVHCAGLKPATVERYRGTAQAALNYAAREWGIDAPRLPRESFKNGRLRYLTEEEQEILLAAYTPHVRPVALTPKSTSSSPTG